MRRQILSHNGTTQNNFYYSDDSIVTETVQDVEPILRQNSALRSHGRNKKAQGFIGASVPVTLHNKWVKEWRQKYSDKWTLSTFLSMKVNSRDYSRLRTTDMKI